MRVFPVRKLKKLLAEYKDMGLRPSGGKITYRGAFVVDKNGEWNLDAGIGAKVIATPAGVVPTSAELKVGAEVDQDTDSIRSGDLVLELTFDRGDT